MSNLFLDNTQIILAILVGIVFALSAISKKFPHITWLHVFRIHDHRTEEQKARMKRWANVRAAYEMMLIGFVLPIGYLLLTIFMFREPDPVILAGTCVGGLFFIGLGIWFRARSR